MFLLKTVFIHKLKKIRKVLLPNPRIMAVLGDVNIKAAFSTEPFCNIFAYYHSYLNTSHMKKIVLHICRLLILKKEWHMD